MTENQFLETEQKTQFAGQGFGNALILIIIAAFISILVGFLVLTVTKIFPGFEIWSVFTSYTLSFGLLLLIAQKWWQVHSFDTKKVNLIVYLLLIPVVFAMAIIMESVVSFIPMPEKIQQMFEKMIQINMQGYLTLAIAAPILEELIFRGVVLKKFLQKYSPTKAIVLSSVIFGVAHMNPWQFIPAFAIGLAIGWIYWKTKSIWPGIFIHFTNNSLSFYMVKKYESINITFFDIVGNTTYYISLIIISLLICYSIYLILEKYFLDLESVH